MDERIAHFERTEDRVQIGDSFPKKNGTTLPKSAKYKLGSVTENCFRFLRTSRFGGIPLALLYGFFTWYYLAFFLLSEPAALPDVKNNSALSSVFQSNLSFECQFSFTVLNDNQTDYNDTATMSTAESVHIISAGTAGVVGLTLAAVSVFSKHTRCAMTLIVPSLFAGRGRALILTWGMGLLIDGPVTSMNYNIEQIVNSLTCMYSQMKTLACKYRVDFKAVFGQVADILKQVHENVKARINQLADDVDKLTGEARERALAAKREAERQLADLEKKINDAKNVIDAPGRFFNSVCGGVESVLSDAGDFFTDVGNEIGDFFGGLFKRRRRKRSTCVPPILPDVNVDVPGVDLSALQDFIKQMRPDIDVLDLNLDDFRNVLRGSSISDIRLKIINILKDVFRVVTEYFYVLKKFFYAASLILVCIDAVRYLRTYYSDDSYDNKYIDGNLTKLWEDDNSSTYTKLTPLRNWELNERYQVSTSARLAKKEYTRILLQAVPTLIFTTIAICIVVADISLRGLLDVLLKNGQFGIAFDGMEQGLDLGSLLSDVVDGSRSLVSLNLKGFDLSTEPCLPRPVKAEKRRLIWICVIVIGCLISCLFDVYASRWRAQICNQFYQKRAGERAMYLYKRIKGGRGNRRFQLRLLVLREKRRRERLLEFSILTKIWHWIKSLKPSSKAICLGCEWKSEKKSMQKLALSDEANEKLEVDICEDCFKDK